MSDGAEAVGNAGPSRKRQGLTVIAIRLFGAALGLVAQVLASRMIGAEDFGRYSLMLVWLLLLGHGATLGTNQLVTRRLAQYLKASAPEEAEGLLRFAVGLVIATALLLGGGAMTLLALDPFGLDGRLVLVGLLAFSAVPLVALQDFLEAVARGLDRPTIGIGPAFVMRHLAIIFGLGGLLALGAAADAVTVMALTVFGLALSILIQYLLLRRTLRSLLGSSRPRYHRAAWLRTALPIAAVDSAEVLFLNADILILGLFLPPEMVGLYFAATRLSQILGYVPYGITAVTAQRYAALSETHERADLQTLIGKAATANTAISVAGALLLSLAAAPLLGLFGPEFIAAEPVVPLLCLGLCLAAFFGPGEDVLTMLGEERICSAVFIAALALNLGLNFALIPAYGLVGAATASAIALAARGALLCLIAWTRLGLVLPAGLALLPHRPRAVPT